MAHAFHTTTSDLAFVNQLDTSASLSGLQALVVPVTPARGVTGGRTSVYKVRRGDTVVTIADQFGVTVEQLQQWNHISARSLTAGRRVYVAEPARISRASLRTSGRGLRTSAQKSKARSGAHASHQKETAKTAHEKREYTTSKT